MFLLLHGEPRPAAFVVDGMNQRQLPLAVQGFSHDTGLRLHRAEAAVGEIGAAGLVDTDQRGSPPRERKKSATHMSDASCDKLEFYFVYKSEDINIFSVSAISFSINGRILSLYFDKSASCKHNIILGIYCGFAKPT